MNNSNYNDRNNNYINALQRVRNISNPTNISVSANTNSNTNTQSTANEGNFLLRTVGTIEEATRNIKSGFYGTLEGIVDFGVGLLGEVGSWFGASTKWAEDFVKIDIANTISPSIVNHIYEASTGKDLADYSYVNDLSEKAQNIIRGIEQGIGNVSGQILLGVATGGLGTVGSTVATTAGLVTSASGNAFQSALNDNADYSKGLLYSIGSGVTEGISEQLFGGVPGLNVVNRGFKEVIKSFVTEGLEEVFVDLVNPALKSIYNEKSVAENYSTDLNASDLFQTFVIGATTGALATGGRMAYENIYYSRDGQQIVNELRDVNSELETAYNTYKASEQTTLEQNVEAYKAFENVKNQAQVKYNELANRVKQLSDRYQNRISRIQNITESNINTFENVDEVATQEVIDRLNQNRDENNQIEVVFEDDRGQFNGRVSKNTIVISKNPTKAVRQILSHEISHLMDSDTQYSDMKNKIYNEVKNTTEFKKSLEWANKAYKNSNPDIIIDEAITEYIADNYFKSYKDISNAFESKSMLERFKNMVRNLRKNSKSPKLREEYLKLFQKLNNTNVKRQRTNIIIEKSSSKEYNENTKKGGRSDDFRRIQEESRRELDKSSWQERSSRNDETLRKRLSNYFKRELDSRGYNSSSTNAVLLKSNKNTEFRMYKNIDGDLFHDIFEISRTYLLNGELVDLHDNYNDSTCYLSDDGLSGFAITKNGDLISVFNLDKSKKGFLSAISSIVKENAKTLDCYVSPNQNLQEMYTKMFGFKTASIMDYNMDYDHDNIAKNHNNPQVAFMINTNENVETKHFNENQYDEAVNYQKSFFEKYSKKETEVANVVNKRRNTKEVQVSSLKTAGTQNKLTKTLDRILKPNNKNKVWDSQKLERSLQVVRDEIASKSATRILTSKFKKGFTEIQNYFENLDNNSFSKLAYINDSSILERLNYINSLDTKTLDATIELDEFSGETTLDLANDVLTFFEQITRKDINNRKETEKQRIIKMAESTLNQVKENKNYTPKMNVFSSNYLSGIIDNKTYYAFFNNDFLDSMTDNMNRRYSDSLLERMTLTNELDSILSNRKIKKGLNQVNAYGDLGLTNSQLIDVYLLAGTDGAYYNFTAEGISLDSTEQFRRNRKNKTNQSSLLSGKQITDKYLDKELTDEQREDISTFAENEMFSRYSNEFNNVETQTELYELLKKIRDDFDKQVGNKRTSKKKTNFDKKLSENKKSLRDMFNDLKKEATESLRNDIYNNYLSEYHEVIGALERLYNGSETKRIYTESSDQMLGYHYNFADNYYPLSVDSSIRYKETSNQENFSIVYNPSFSKPRQFNSNTRIVIRDSITKAYNFANNLSIYHNLTPLIAEYNDILNERVIDPDTKEKSSFYEYADKNLDSHFSSRTTNMFRLAQGMRNTDRRDRGFDRILNRTRAMFSTYVLGFNLKSIISPMVSIPLVRNYVSRRSAINGFSNKGKASFDVLLEKSPQTKLRFERGNYVEIKSLGGRANALTEFAMKPMENSEKTLFKYIWNVSQNEAKSLGYGDFNTETNINKATEIFENITFNTQAQFDVINNSSWIYNGSELTKSMLVFTADSRKQLSLLVRTANKLIYEHKRIKANPNDNVIMDAYKKSRRDFAKAVTTNLETLVAFTLLGSIFKFLKGNYDDEEPKEILLDTTKDFMFGQVLGLFPGISDVTDLIINDYEISLGSIQVINDAINDFKGVYDALISGNTSPTTISKFINAVGRIAGIPTKNILDNIYMPLRLFSPETALKMKNMFYGYSGNQISNFIKTYADRKQPDRLSAAIEVKMENNGFKVPENVADEMARLYIVNDNDNIMPKTFSNSINVNGEKIDLSNKVQKQLYQIYNMANEQMELLLNRSYYLNLTDEEKAYAIQKLYDAYYELAKSSVFDGYTATKLGSIANYIDVGKFACILAKTSQIKTTETTTRKDQVVSYINSQRLSKAEKFLALELSGYSLNEENQNLVIQYLKDKGLTI